VSPNNKDGDDMSYTELLEEYIDNAKRNGLVNFRISLTKNNEPEKVAETVIDMLTSQTVEDTEII